MNVFKDPYGILTIVAAKEFAEAQEESKIKFLFSVEVNSGDLYCKQIITLQSELNKHLETGKTKQSRVDTVLAVNTFEKKIIIF